MNGEGPEYTTYARLPSVSVLGTHLIVIVVVPPLYWVTINESPKVAKKLLRPFDLGRETVAGVGDCTCIMSIRLETTPSDPK
jgi:hypothetical protein